MTTESNKEIVRRFYEEAWARGEMDVVDELFDDEYVRHDFRPGEPQDGAQGQKDIAVAFRNAFPDVVWQIDFIIGEGDFVMGRWTASGTNEGAWAGVEPTGRSIRFSGINVFRFSGGKVVEVWNHRDDLGLMQQLGAVA
jgi:steroid delta-isomerase-like uncharacterized protein